MSTSTVSNDQGLLDRQKIEITIRLDKYGSDQIEALTVINNWRANISRTEHTDHRFVLWSIEFEGSRAQCDLVTDQFKKWII